MDVHDAEYHRLRQELNHLHDAIDEARAQARHATELARQIRRDRDILAAEVRAWRQVYMHPRIEKDGGPSPTYRLEWATTLSDQSGAITRAEQEKP